MITKIMSSSSLFLSLSRFFPAIPAIVQWPAALVVSSSVVGQSERELEDVQIKTASTLTDSFTPSLTTMKVKRGEEAKVKSPSNSCWPMIID